MAQSKEERISRQELLQVITDHTDKLGNGAPLQVAVLAWVKQLVLAMPAKAVQVELVRCGDCVSWSPTPTHECPTLGVCNLAAPRLRSSCEFCNRGKRRADHGG